MGLALGQYIKSVRKTAKMSAVKLSKDAGISKSYLDYIESGAREPAVEILAKIAAVLQLPLEALLDVQKKEKLESAINKLRAENVTLTDDDIRAVARTADSSQDIDQQALAKAQEAFRDTNNAAKYADYIENPDLRAIVKAGARLSGVDLEKLRKVMQSLYPDEFRQ
ncbi:MAG: helix-turn-helix domain-containing protein [Bacteroidia bacterium]|jgi:transcriptional regulator with XRE-family HTH domain|nr:helix-turn-helix domain-containing protein [Bacteroidia bacterium]